MNCWKYWKKCGSNGYGLHLDDSGFEVGYLYLNENEGDSFVAYIDGRRNEITLTAETLRGKQKEAERWLVGKYEETIERHEKIATNFRERVSVLKREEYIDVIRR